MYTLIQAIKLYDSNIEMEFIIVKRTMLTNEN